MLPIETTIIGKKILNLYSRNSFQSGFLLYMKKYIYWVIMFNVKIGISLSARFLYIFFEHLSSIYLCPMQKFFEFAQKTECLAWCIFVTRHNNMPFLSRFYLNVALGKACINEQFSFILNMILLSHEETYLNTSISNIHSFMIKCTMA